MLFTVVTNYPCVNFMSLLAISAMHTHTRLHDRCSSSSVCFCLTVIAVHSV